MNSVFKMMAVVLALGVLVLQGCQTVNTSREKALDIIHDINKGHIPIYNSNGQIIGTKPPIVHK